MPDQNYEALARLMARSGVPARGPVPAASPTAGASGGSGLPQEIVGSAGQAAPAGAPAPAAPPAPPRAPVNDLLPPPTPDQMQDIDAEFWRRHGRAPTAVDLQMIRATPVLQANLGRPPLRVELLQYLQSRDETPRSNEVFRVAPSG